MNNIFKKGFYIGSNEKGSTLIISVLILLLLTVIGIAATNTSTIEILISGNDKVHKMAFHQADGGTEVGIVLVEQEKNLVSFDSTDLANLGDVNVTSATPSFNEINDMPSDSNRDAYLPKNYTGNEPHTNLTMDAGELKDSGGGSVIMAAGYEGKGKDQFGGYYRVYDIWSQHIGKANSEAIILLQWRQVIQ